MADPANTTIAGQTLDLSFGPAVNQVNSWIDGAIRLLPNFIFAVVVFAVFWGLALLAQKLILRSSTRRKRDNLGEVLGGFVKWMVLLLGFLLAATIVIPSLKPGDLIAGLGVSSVAIGFAFKDILQNWLAGLLLLLRQPFEVGDQIEVDGFEGTVRRIETRATIIKTYDGQRVVIPNSNVYTNSVIVKTAHEKRRSQYDIGIGYGDGIDEACEVIRKAIGEIREVEQEPAPEALPWELAASTVNIRARWWTHSRRVDVVRVHAQVITAVKNALDAAGIDMPYETQVQLFHDQSEDVDGERGVQREGWPKKKGGSTQPRWRVAGDGKATGEGEDRRIEREPTAPKASESPVPALSGSSEA